MDAEGRRARLIGTRRLAAASYRDGDGQPADSPLGADPTGLLIYTSDGHVAALISHAKRRLRSVGDRLTAPADERADAFGTFFSYGGRYVVSGDEVRHRVEVASIENWVGNELICLARFEGERPPRFGRHVAVPPPRQANAPFIRYESDETARPPKRRSRSFRTRRCRTPSGRSGASLRGDRPRR